MGLHAFGYANGNPVKYTDPSGEFICAFEPALCANLATLYMFGRSLLSSDSQKRLDKGTALAFKGYFAARQELSRLHQEENRRIADRYYSTHSHSTAGNLTAATDAALDQFGAGLAFGTVELAVSLPFEQEYRLIKAHQHAWGATKDALDPSASSYQRWNSGAEVLGVLSQDLLIVAGTAKSLGIGSPARAPVSRPGAGQTLVGTDDLAGLDLAAPEGLRTPAPTAEIGLRRPSATQLDLHRRITLRGYMQQASELDVSTAPHSATFWSGPGNRARATAFAASSEKTTLEMTPGGLYLNNEALFKRLPSNMAIQPWRVLSRRFAAGASGEVNLFVNGAGPSGVFRTIEEPALELNPNICKYIYRGY
jgi:hypothetical protein